MSTYNLRLSLKKPSLTVTGFKPAIPRSEVWCLIRLATQPQVELDGYWKGQYVSVSVSATTIWG